MKSLDGIVKVLEPILGKAAALLAAIDIIGLEISPDLIKRIEQAEADEAEAKRKAQEQPTTPPQEKPVTVDTEMPAETTLAPAMTAQQTKALVELDKWQLKSEKAGKLVAWHAVSLGRDVAKAVQDGMTWDDAREMLTGAHDKPVEVIERPDIKSLADAINRATDAHVMTAKATNLPMMAAPSYVVNLTAQMPAPGEPTISVNVPQQAAPVVNVSVPEQPAPIVNVTNDVAAPVVNVTAVPGESRLIMPAPKPVEIIRNADGLAKEIRPKG